MRDNSDETPLVIFNKQEIDTPSTLLSIHQDLVAISTELNKVMSRINQVINQSAEKPSNWTVYSGFNRVPDVLNPVRELAKKEGGLIEQYFLQKNIPRVGEIGAHMDALGKSHMLVLDKDHFIILQPANPGDHAVLYGMDYEPFVDNPLPERFSLLEKHIKLAANVLRK